MPHHPTWLNLSERLPIKEIPSLETFSFFFTTFYIILQFLKRYDCGNEADTQKPSNKKSGGGGGKSKTTGGTSLKKEKKKSKHTTSASKH